MNEEDSPTYPPLVRLSQEEKSKLVKDLLAEQIFTVKHIPESAADLAYAIFTPLGFGCFATAPQEYREQIGMIYEYRSRALARSVNGFPVFASLRIVHKDDWIEILQAFVEQHNALDKALMEKFGVETKPA